MRPRKRKRKMLEDESPLERLPAEVLQQVFEYSANVGLPLVSRETASKLSKSNYLQHQLTVQLLKPVFGNSSATSKELSDATRLLNSKFMTFEFFTKWLQAYALWMDTVEDSEEPWSNSQVRDVWLALQPSSALLPPKKLLSSPFNQEKAQFLEVLSHHVQDLAGMDAAYGELAHVGLVAAVRQSHREMVQLLLSMGLTASTEMLRVAVTESGCDREIVRMLIDKSENDRRDPNMDEGRPAEIGSSPDAVDLLDPVLWSWADEARRRGNKKGGWLMELLKEAQQRKRYTDQDQLEATTR